jgi:uncharacterized protein YdeI (BOF family)
MTRNIFFASLFLALPTLAVAETTITALQPNTQVTISGTVDRITDEDTFVLRDASGEIEIYLGPNLVPVAVGNTVTVSGLVDDGPLPEIYARSLVTAEGETITFEYNYD